MTLLMAIGLSVSTAAIAQTDGFASAMDAAMTRMHGAMMTGYSNDPDRDFARMMIPHHQGAIDMAEIELRYAKTNACAGLRRESSSNSVRKSR